MNNPNFPSASKGQPNLDGLQSRSRFVRVLLGVLILGPFPVLLLLASFFLASTRSDLERMEDLANAQREYQSLVDLVYHLQLERGHTVRALIAGDKELWKSARERRSELDEHFSKFAATEATGKGTADDDQGKWREQVKNKVLTVRQKIDQGALESLGSYTLYSSVVRDAMERSVVISTRYVIPEILPAHRLLLRSLELYEITAKMRALGAYLIETESRGAGRKPDEATRSEFQFLGQNYRALIDGQSGHSGELAGLYVGSAAEADSRKTIEDLIQGLLRGGLSQRLTSEQWFARLTARVEKIKTDVNKAFTHYVGKIESTKTRKHRQIAALSLICLLGIVAGPVVGSLLYTKLIKAYRRLDELNVQKSRILGAVAHDLRNPISSILGFSEVLLEERKDEHHNLEPGSDLELLKIIQSSAQFSMELLEDLVDVTAVESGKIVLRLDEVDLRALIEKTVGLFHLRLNQKGIRVVKALGAETAVVQCDKTRIEQVIQNLLSNAIKFSSRGTEITITLSKGGAGVLIEIADQGVGMSADDLSRLFRPFEKLSSRPTEGEKSTGIGLAISHRTIVEHGGKLWAESEKGKGSRFFLRLNRTVS